MAGERIRGSCVAAYHTLERARKLQQLADWVCYRNDNELPISPHALDEANRAAYLKMVNIGGYDLVLRTAGLDPDQYRIKRSGKLLRPDI